MKNLVGKTIEKVVDWECEGIDDENVKQIIFSDGSSTFIVADYGGYTGNSADEYPAYLLVMDENEFNEWNSGFGWDYNKYKPI